MRAAVVITTRNRKDELRTALRSAFEQKPQLAVIVIDDGSNDGTAEMVNSEFPRAELHRFAGSEGLIFRRNKAAQLLAGRIDIIFSIDDDAAFSSPNIVERTLVDFESTRIGAVAIPYVDVRKNSVVHQSAPNSIQPWISDTFIGTAHALRLDVFLALGGYRSHLIHQGEERDYCMRMLQAGFVVRLGSSEIIKHFESPNRDMRRMDFYGRRNDVLFAWHNVPMPYFPMHFVATLANGIRNAFQTGRFRHMLSGMLCGFGDCIRLYSERSPVAPEVYRLNRRLKKNGPRRLEEIEDLLPPVSLLKERNCTSLGIAKIGDSSSS